MMEIIAGAVVLLFITLGVEGLCHYIDNPRYTKEQLKEYDDYLKSQGKKRW